MFQMLEVKVKSRQVVFRRSLLLLSPMKEKTGSNDRPQSLEKFLFPEGVGSQKNTFRLILHEARLRIRC